MAEGTGLRAPSRLRRPAPTEGPGHLGASRSRETRLSDERHPSGRGTPADGLRVTTLPGWTSCCVPALLEMNPRRGNLAVDKSIGDNLLVECDHDPVR